MRRSLISFVVTVGILGSCLLAHGAPPTPGARKAKAKASAAKKAAAGPKVISPAPTLADVHYGPHPKQVLHVWKAESDKPTPLLFFIHGGGWQGGDRTSGLTGLPCELVYPGAPDVKHPRVQDYLIEKLKEPATKKD